MRRWIATYVGIVGALTGGATAQDSLVPKARDEQPVRADEAERPVQTTEAEQVEAAATIAIRQSDPGWFVFLVYRGPYWKAGTEFQQVRSYLEEHAINGAIFARYSASPMSPGETAQHVEIGSFVGETHEPRPPFEKTWRNVETTACMTIEGRAGTTRQDYATIGNWIDRRGYQAAGPVTEIYYHGTATGATDRIQTEIRVALDTSGSLRNVDRPEPSPNRATHQPSPSHTIEGIGNATAPRTVEPQAAAGITLAANSVTEAASNESHSTGEDADTAGSSPKPREPAPTAPPQALAPALSELVGAGRFDEVAARVVPLDADLSGAMQIWLGQIVFRVGAIAKGVDRISPQEAPPIAGIGEALRRRYREASANLDLRPLDHAVVRVDTRGGADAAEMRAVMHGLDALMSRIALGTIQAAAVETEIVEILEQIQELTRPPADTGPEPSKDEVAANPM